MLTRDEKKFLVHSRSDNGLRCTRFTFLNSCRLILTTSRSYCVIDLYRIKSSCLSFSSYRESSPIFLFFLLRSVSPLLFKLEQEQRTKYFLDSGFDSHNVALFFADNGNIFASLWIEVKALFRARKKKTIFNRTYTYSRITRVNRITRA